jgi:hypothetical protein
MDFLDGLNGPSFDTSLGVGVIFKLLFFVILTGYVLYSFMLALRVRILSETVNVGPTKFVASIVYAHVVFAIIGSFVAFLIALLA